MYVCSFRQIINAFFLQVILWYELKLSSAVWFPNSLWIQKDVRKVKENKYPFVVAIILNNPEVPEEQNHICGGSLIAPQLVLTSAHCLNGTGPDELKVVAGSIDLRAGIKYNIQSWIVYDDWAKKKNIIPKFDDNDVAILKLTNEVDRSIKIGALANKLNDSHVIAVSWGSKKKSETRYLYEVWLHKLKIDKASKEVEKISGEKVSIPENYFMSQIDPHAEMHCGDSGSPLIKQSLFNKYKIIGLSIASCPSLVITKFMKTLHIHLSVDSYRTFINDVMATF